MMAAMTSAVVVGSGPNGLAAALTLAAAGVSVRVLEAADELGGGLRSGELTLPGLTHDLGSGFHPLALDSAFAAAFDLTTVGLVWRWPEVQFAHPLDGGRGAAVWHDVDRTAAELGPDGAAWSRLYGPLAARFPAIAAEFLRPVLHLPRHPAALARFGLAAALPAAVLARRWHDEEARALFAGAAAHALRPFTEPLSAAIGVALTTAAHSAGWPVAEGGSASIAAAMVSLGRSYGATYETGVRVDSLAELRAGAEADLVLLDTSPRAAAAILGEELPGRVRRAYGRYRHGPGSFKVDYAVAQGVPWTHEPSRRAGTVHVGGSFEQVAVAERDAVRARMPEAPYVLVGQQHVADPTRSADDVHPVSAYAHVPAGWTGDATAAITAQIERFAPGFRDRVLATHTTSTGDLGRDNPNWVGGDILTGSNDPRQLVLRPRATLTPYATGVPGVWLCSAATPPGAGAHGMCGHLAARAALASLA